eukprot:MONOS_7793.1-p1 / transcript=MONOS_7793.1 / gene=MONOS_7793 / organism=Monocercomonoides_exilis_PA203 / gene_product=unspecified product / transcript_product=unspecified product / location=Mono_scaffold00276:19276-19809(-) / protein_length=178 / sequence_SO=supercontig / SO=protein_coding / is_pseudo=false
MKMIKSEVSQCSYVNGKGGGVYLAIKERGELNFTFAGMKFSANTASVGNDIFIECFNITFQINERQFQFDFREDNYNRSNAIYGRDLCNNTNDTDLIGFITIHQSDTIIVTIRWRKAKKENKDLREIVNDNIRKDPKAFEIVTMEMSPEEQWRRQKERKKEREREEREREREREIDR